jgi:hypothetical protein
VQLLRNVEGDGRVRERNVSAAARGLKDVSGELGVPVLALVQLNLNRATRPDKRPQLADLRSRVIWRTLPTQYWGYIATRWTTRVATIKALPSSVC